ncbi:MAG: SHOCT domain-containing protein [Chloroflexi bacterium]|nr:SHOCT domain-containing protein [Chloroflexota bacterium]MBV9599956.1 SHOCT domain-containing protein [Chloroflexota bacterium]
MGLIKTAVKTAVAVKTAHVVHDRIQRRQSEQWAAQGIPPAGAPPASAAPAAVDDTLTRLTRLGELRAAGVITEAEFEQQKARILASV